MEVTGAKVGFSSLNTPFFYSLSALCGKSQSKHFKPVAFKVCECFLVCMKWVWVQVCHAVWCKRL